MKTVYWLFVLFTMVFAITTSGCGSTTGEKTVTVIQPVSSSPGNSNAAAKSTAASAPVAPATFTGLGPTSTAKFSLSEGLYRVSVTHDGSSNFIVHLLDSKGKSVEGMVNEIGPVNQQNMALRIDKTGEYLLDIKADGNWSVTLQAD